ncbi:hypothetical protein [Nitrospirillum sp. BR 11163]|uniref:hypothetical protein n=1 Tax=Nitrospirillum sp. BR 11163 TaxID=3104323 RepID=UPI002AFE58EC|nr:hypothetical protein [Nitrospirillum sp. BR 11163]MEA1675011.1 hypothetical protein [Nitrospirillum sp. BR 11163]
MADPRDELLRQIRAIRRRIDPDVLEKAAAAAERMQAARSPRPAEEPAEIPIDREAARDVVMTFLQSRHDGGRFAMKLMEEMKKKPEAAAKAYDKAAPKPTRKV